MTLSLAAKAASHPDCRSSCRFSRASPEQRDAVLKLGMSGGGGLGSLGGNAAAGSTAEWAGRSGSDQQDDRMQRISRRLDLEGRRGGAFIPVFKAEDWLIVEIDYQLPPRPTPPRCSH